MPKQNDRAKARATGLTPYPDQPIMKHGFGPPVFHGIGGTPRFGIALPAAAQGPIRARETRARKGLPGYGPNPDYAPVPSKKRRAK